MNPSITNAALHAEISLFKPNFFGKEYYFIKVFLKSLYESILQAHSLNKLIRNLYI